MAASGIHTAPCSQPSEREAVDGRAGLVEHGYQIDFDDWHAYVHGTLPYERLLAEDSAMRALLQSIPLPKYVFTNADRAHAERCLRLMGITDLFQVSPLPGGLADRLSSPCMPCPLSLDRGTAYVFIWVCWHSLDFTCLAACRTPSLRVQMACPPIGP